MDILNQIVSVTNIQAYLLLQSRGLSPERIKQVMILAGSCIVRAYAASSHQHQAQGASAQDLNVLDFKVDTRALAARLDLAPKLTVSLLQLLVPDVLARMHRHLRGDARILDQFYERDAA